MGRRHKTNKHEKMEARRMKQGIGRDVDWDSLIENGNQHENQHENNDANQAYMREYEEWLRSSAIK